MLLAERAYEGSRSSNVTLGVACRACGMGEGLTMTDSISFQKVKTGSPQESVLRRLDSVVASDREQTKVLDIPTGGGIVAFPLSASGFDVTGCDLFPEDALDTVSKL
jgi:2-polyprenyl-3-methyl-5-hydroxy-6-metoxy-1,4-benzoquinol methylase